MDMLSLQLLVDVIESKSLSRAAEKNFVSQSAVSQRLRMFERAIGVTLVDRSRGRGVLEPTAAGAFAYENGKRILSEISQLDTELRDFSDPDRGTVSVATVYSVGLHALPRVLKPFLHSHPKLHVDIQYKQTEQVYADVSSGAVDVGIVAGMTSTKNLTSVPFQTEQMVFICAPENRLSDRTMISLSALEGLWFIGFDDDVPTRKVIDSQLAKHDARVRYRTTSDNIETIKNLVEIGNGVSIVPEGTVKQEVSEGRIRAIPLMANEKFTRQTALIYRKNRKQSHAVAQFIAALRED